MLTDIMTDEIAYQLGKLDFPHLFYDTVMWKLNKEEFPLAYFFNWYFPGGLGGMAAKQEGDHYVTDWENQSIGGSVKFDKIKEISHKLNYIRGRLSSYSVTITENTIHVNYANSRPSRDFFTKCLNDIIYDKFSFLSVHKISTGTEYYCPLVEWVKLEADKEAIDYIVGEKN
jgi:hypothetical protein